MFTTILLATIIVDDYREAYWWLRDKTPEDSRVMAWWDYGYQPPSQVIFVSLNGRSPTGSCRARWIFAKSRWWSNQTLRYHARVI